MGNCIHCGQSAGMLNKHHKECEGKHQEGRSLFLGQVMAAAEAKLPIEILEGKLREIQSSHFIANELVRSLLVQGWETAVSEAFDDGVLTEDEEAGLAAISENFGLAQAELDKKGLYSQFVKGGLLRDLMNGRIPDRISVSGTLPFNL